MATQLAKLGPQWHVIHSILIGDTGTDLDHLVIGPGGVYTINTKNHPKKNVWVAGNTFMVSGQRQPYIHASRNEAKKVSGLLTTACGFPVSATSVIAVVNADLTVKEEPHDVHIAGRRRIARWLSAQPQCLSDGQVAAIFAVARQSKTW